APPSRDKAQAGTKAAAEPAERDKESKEKKKGKVLKSLAELSLEDFGFTSPSGPSHKGRGQGRGG
ncbi:MAG TPA: hypothetical protein VIL11_07135, partial [Limnochordales bacterium]